MQDILCRIEDTTKQSKEYIKKYCRRNKVNIDIASNFTILKLRFLYKRFLKIYQENPQRVKFTWIQNELKAYHWLLIAVSALQDKLIENFTHKEWDLFSKVFIGKDTSNLNYEAIKLIYKSCKKNSWTEEEDKLLIDIHRSVQYENKWSEIARKLFEKSDRKYFKCAKQCRERWFNHLDPQKKHGQWKPEEDRAIVQFILNKGRKWSQISRKLNNHRTQHMVKNRVKSIVIRQQKLNKKKSKHNNEDFLLQQFLNNDLDQIQKQKSKQVNVQVNVMQVQSEDEMAKILTGQGPAPKDIICKQQAITGLSNNSNANHTIQMQQVFTPFYMNYQALTPNYLSNSPSIPFFMNSSFALYDNSRVDQFLRNGKADNQ